MSKQLTLSFLEKCDNTQHQIDAIMHAPEVELKKLNYLPPQLRIISGKEIYHAGYPGQNTTIGAQAATAAGQMAGISPTGF